MKNWVLILGASSGIGAACAKEFAKHGFNIYGIYLRKPNSHIESLTKELESYKIQVVFKKANAANSDNRNTIVSELIKNKINIKAMIHSLAFGTLKPFIDTNQTNQINQKNIEMTMDVMSHSLIYWTQELFYHNLLSPGSQIISMTSAGNEKHWKAYGAVSMAKAALESAARQLAFELAKYNIACNCIQAGVTLTPALEKIPGYQNMISIAKKTNPHKRLTTTEDVAKATVLLGLSSEHWLTGNIIKVDGGESLTN